MKDVLKALKRHWITVWLFVVVLMLLGTFVTYSVYTEVSSVKRVVTTKSAPKDLFSSNCMYADLYNRRIPSKEYSIELRNYDASFPDIPNPTEIEYTLTAQLRANYNGSIMTMAELENELGSNSDVYADYVEEAKEFTICKSQEDDPSGTIRDPVGLKFSDYTDYTIVFPAQAGYETLPGGNVHTDKFKITVSEDDFSREEPKFYIYVKADAVDGSLTDLQTQLYGAKNVVITSSWLGTIAERNTSTLDYDFYNYIITGSGSGKLDIMWDPQWFEVNEFFFTSLSGVTFENDVTTPSTISGGEHDGWNKVTIIVDSSEKSRYELQLYKTNPNTPYTGDNNAETHIDCKLQNQNEQPEAAEEPTTEP